MKKIPKEIYSYVSSIQEVNFFHDGAYLITNDGTYLYLDHATEEEVYSYLSDISFSSFYPLVNSLDNSYQLFFLGKSPKKENFLPILLELYQKSSHEVLWDSFQIEKVYQKIQSQYQELSKYYYDLQDTIEEMYYPRKSFYDLLLSISSIHHLIPLGSFFLEKWKGNGTFSYQEVLTVHNLNSNNYFDEKIVDFSSSRKDYFIYELANYYQKYYKEKSILYNIDSFLDELAATIGDKTLFYSLICILWKIDGELTREVDDLLFYVEQTSSYLLEKYKEYEETEKGMFKEEKKDV